MVEVSTGVVDGVRIVDVPVIVGTPDPNVVLILPHADRRSASAILRNNNIVDSDM